MIKRKQIISRSDIEQLVVSRIKAIFPSVTKARCVWVKKNIVVYIEEEEETKINMEAVNYGKKIKG